MFCVLFKRGVTKWNIQKKNIIKIKGKFHPRKRPKGPGGNIGISLLFL
jgi:hypothetical protein